MNKSVQVGVGVWIINPIGQVLMGERTGSHGAGTWAPPGGHLEFGETPQDCASRELMEETGVKIAPKRFQFIGMTNDIFSSEKHYITLHYCARNILCNPAIAEPNKCLRWTWFDMNNLPQNLFLPARNLITQHGLGR